METKPTRNEVKLSVAIDRAKSAQASMDRAIAALEKAYRATGLDDDEAERAARNSLA